MNFFALCENVVVSIGATEGEITSVYWFHYVLHDVVIQQFSFRVFFQTTPINKNPSRW